MRALEMHKRCKWTHRVCSCATQHDTQWCLKSNGNLSGWSVLAHVCIFPNWSAWWWLRAPQFRLDMAINYQQCKCCCQSLSIIHIIKKRLYRNDYACVGLLWYGQQWRNWARLEKLCPTPPNFLKGEDSFSTSECCMHALVNGKPMVECFIMHKLLNNLMVS